jgi:type IV pilus assembly protein PilA
MVRSTNNRSRGFTLIELMIVVAIIGILASVAIPSFLNYQLTSKRSEAFANLSALAKAQKSYFAEYNTFIGVASEPAGALGVAPTTSTRNSASIDGAFAAVGWAPEGDVFFDYDTATPATPLAGTCGAAVSCFTSTAYGDLDGDGFLSVLVYTHPDAAGQFCGTGQAGDLSPPVGGGGALRFDEPARLISVPGGPDDF